jgi:hypothetical protein
MPLQFSEHRLKLNLFKADWNIFIKKICALGGILAKSFQ